MDWNHFSIRFHFGVCTYVYVYWLGKDLRRLENNNWLIDIWRYLFLVLGWILVTNLDFDSCLMYYLTYLILQKCWTCMALLYKLRSVQNTGTWYLRPRAVCRVHLGFGLSASAQFLGKPADRPKTKCAWQTARGLGYKVTIFCTDQILLFL